MAVGACWVAAAARAGEEPGTVGLGAGVSFFTPTDKGANPTALYSLGGHYWLTRHVVPSLEVGYAHYNARDLRIDYVPVFLRVAYHFGSNRVFDPYLGAGPVYSRKWWTGNENRSVGVVGASALAGLNIIPGNKFNLGFGVEFVLADANNFDSGYPAFNVSLGAGEQ